MAKYGPRVELFALFEIVNKDAEGFELKAVGVSSDYTTVRDLWDDRSNGKREHAIARIPLDGILQAIGELRAEGTIA